MSSHLELYWFETDLRSSVVSYSVLEKQMQLEELRRNFTNFYIPFATPFMTTKNGFKEFSGFHVAQFSV